MQINPLPPEKLQLDLLANTDIGIFVSANAVDAFEAHGLSLPQSAICLAVGAKTASLAAERGIDAASGDAFDSETLLQLPQLQRVEGRRILIFRGVGGREYLAKQLRARGAIVNYYEMYKRSCPEGNAAAFQECLRSWQPHVISAGSIETLENSLLLGAECFSDRPINVPAFLVPGARVADFARSIGVKHCIQSRSMRLSDVLSSLKDWWN
jgi:uroporphyrinogen-III synthase